MSFWGNHVTGIKRSQRLRLMTDKDEDGRGSESLLFSKVDGRGRISGISCWRSKTAHFARSTLTLILGCKAVNCVARWPVSEFRPLVLKPDSLPLFSPTHPCLRCLLPLSPRSPSSLTDKFYYLKNVSCDSTHPLLLTFASLGAQPFPFTFERNSKQWNPPHTL